MVRLQLILSIVLIAVLGLNASGQSRVRVNGGSVDAIQRIRVNGDTTPVVPPSPVPDADVSWNFDQGAGQWAFNSSGPNTANDNAFGLGNDGSFLGGTSRTGWSINNTVTDRAGLAPDGQMTAMRMQGAENDWIGIITDDLTPGGQYTMSVWVKSNTGSPQTTTMWPAFGHSQTSSLVVPTTWTKLSTTFTATNHEMLYGIFIYGNATYDILVADAKLNTGAASTTFVDDYQYDFQLGKNGTPDGNDPAWTSEGLHFTSANQSAFAIHRGLSIPTVTAYSVMKIDTDPADQGGVVPIIMNSCGGTEQNDFRVSYQDAGPVLYIANEFSDPSNEILKANDGQWHIWTTQYDGTLFKIWVDGLPLSETTNAGLGPVVLKHMELGRIDCASYGFTGDLGMIRLFADVHDASTRAAVENDMRALMEDRGVGLANGDHFYYSIGDSITAGSGVDTQATFNWLAVTTLPTPGVGRRLGQGGSSVIGYSHTAEVDATFQAGKTNTLIVFFGANDLLDSSAATFKANLKAFCLARRAVGWKIVLLTVLPHTGNGVGGVSFNILRAAANTLIRGDTSFYDALADVGDTGTTMGADAAAVNATYYQDGVHPTTAGHALLAPIVEAAIELIP